MQIESKQYRQKKLSGTALCFGVEERTESERRKKIVLLNPKGEQRPTKVTLKQVNTKIDLKVTEIITQLSIRDYANRVKMAQAKKGNCNALCFGVEE